MQLNTLKSRQGGQGMTEYIIIVALVAVSAIVVYNMFGDTIRGQVGDMAAELGGGSSGQLGKAAADKAKAEGANDDYNLSNFSQEEGGSE